MKQTSINLFVYGTLKKGHPAYDRFCRNAAQLSTARLRGRLYLLPEGYPILEVPQEDILAFGSGDIPKDTALEKQMAGLCSGKPFYPGAGAEWQEILGEILRLENPLETLPDIDEYENFSPSGKSLYQRVLVLVDSPAGRKTAWTYVVAGDSKKDQLRGARFISVWPPQD